MPFQLCLNEIKTIHGYSSESQKHEIVAENDLKKLKSDRTRVLVLCICYLHLSSILEPKLYSSHFQIKSSAEFKPLFLIRVRTLLEKPKKPPENTKTQNQKTPPKESHKTKFHTQKKKKKSKALKR